MIQKFLLNVHLKLEKLNPLSLASSTFPGGACGDALLFIWGPLTPSLSSCLSFCPGVRHQPVLNAWAHSPSPQQRSRERTVLFHVVGCVDQPVYLKLFICLFCKGSWTSSCGSFLLEHITFPSIKLASYKNWCDFPCQMTIMDILFLEKWYLGSAASFSRLPYFVSVA